MSNSKVLDTYVAALAAQDVDRAEPLQRQVEDLQIDIDEREVAVRCLTAAAQTWRDALDADNPAEPISNGTQAYMELEIAREIQADGPTEQIKAKLIEALEVACDRLGPMPGGALGKFKAPEGAPHIVQETQPSVGDLAEMAQAAGEAVGIAASQGRANSVAALSQIVEPGDPAPDA